MVLKAAMEIRAGASGTYLALHQLLDDAEQQLYPGKQVTFEVLNEYGIFTMQITAE